MGSVLLFIFGAIVSVMFLGMLWGDRLSLVGLFDGDWLSPAANLTSKLWVGLCDAVDSAIEFVMAHLSWVVAAVSGTAGLILVGFMMGGGLASDAAAWHRDTTTPLKSGGVIDQIEPVAAAASQSPIILTRMEPYDHDLVSQAATADYRVFGRPTYARTRPQPRRPIEGSIDYPGSRSITDEPFLDVTFRRLGSSVIREEPNEELITRGRLFDSLPDPRFVDRIVLQLLRDNWRQSVGLPNGDVGLPQDVLEDSPLAAVRDLESRVQVIPGTFVAEHDLRVEKTVPEESATGEVTIQVILTNLGQKKIDGLLVREIMPVDTQVRGAEPKGVLRDDTLTWLIDDLRPEEERVVRFTILPSSRIANVGDVFESLTEVSALTAVTSATEVVEDRPVRSRRTEEERPVRRRPTVPTKPDLQMVIVEPEADASVGRWTQVLFELSNNGTADAFDVKLRVTLDDSLEQPELLNQPRSDNRHVYVNVPRISAGESRPFRLKVRPTTSGELVSTAEIIYDGAQEGLQTFRIVARSSDDPLLRPESLIR